MFFAFGPEVGYKVLTASGVVGDSGKPQALYGYGFKSGATAGVLTLFDGTSSLGTVVMDQQGLISSTVYNSFGCAVVFTTGLYASFDGNITRASMFVRQVLT
jgi:hypothetical protein